MEVKDEVLEGGRTQRCCHSADSSQQPGAVPGPSLLPLPVCTPAISPEPRSSEEQQCNHWSSLTAGGSWVALGNTLSDLFPEL